MRLVAHLLYRPVSACLIEFIRLPTLVLDALSDSSCSSRSLTIIYHWHVGNKNITITDSSLTVDNIIHGVWSKRRQVKTATSQNGDKPKRLQVQSKRINLLSSTIDLFSELLTKFQCIQLCSFCSSVIS